LAKIVILGPAYPLRGGGMATFNERLARAFMEQGHQVIIYTFSLQYPAFLFPGKTQYSDEPVPADLDIRVRVNSINPFNWFGVGRELKRLKPDLLVVRYWLPFMAPSLGSIAKQVKKNDHTRVIAITDNVIPHEKRPGDRLLTRFFIRRMHGFVTMSEAVGKDLQGFGIASDIISFCPHPLYDNFGDPLPMQQARKELGLSLPPDARLLLFFGFIRPYKGLDLLLKALADPRLAALQVKLLVAGEFYDAPGNYYQLAKELGLDDRVIWHTDFIPDHRVGRYFCAADLVAQPYKSATQSGVTQVAYHFEVPMLVTRVGGLPEMVPHLKVGYVVKPDPPSIADALVDFLENRRGPQMREELKKEKKRFSWERFTQTLIRQSGIVSDKYGN
jgi:D-inositol-3-phosphate glycosyltransferase